MEEWLGRLFAQNLEPKAHPHQQPFGRLARGARLVRVRGDPQDARCEQAGSSDGAHTSGRAPKQHADCRGPLRTEASERVSSSSTAPVVSRAGRGLPQYQERLARCARGALGALIACHLADIDAAKLLRAS